MAAAFSVYVARDSFSIPRPGVVDANGHNLRVFVKGQVYRLASKDAKNLPLDLVDPPVEKATAAPGEKRTTRR